MPPRALRQATEADLAPAPVKPNAPKVRASLDGLDAVQLARDAYRDALETTDEASGRKKAATNEREQDEDVLERAAKDGPRLDDVDPEEAILKAARGLRDSVKAEREAKQFLAQARKDLKSARGTYTSVR